MRILHPTRARGATARKPSATGPADWLEFAQILERRRPGRVVLMIGPVRISELPGARELRQLLEEEQIPLPTMRQIMDAVVDRRAALEGEAVDLKLLAELIRKATPKSRITFSNGGTSVKQIREAINRIRREASSDPSSKKRLVSLYLQLAKAHEKKGENIDRAYALHRAGLVQFTIAKMTEQATDHQLAITYFARAVEVFRTAEPARVSCSLSYLVRARFELARTTEQLADWMRVLSQGVEAENHFRERSEADFLSYCLNYVGEAYFTVAVQNKDDQQVSAENLRLSVKYFAEVRAMFQRTYHIERSAYATARIGQALLRLGRVAEAVENFHIALTVFKRQGNRDKPIGYFYFDLGDALVMLARSTHSSAELLTARVAKLKAAEFFWEQGNEGLAKTAALQAQEIQKQIELGESKPVQGQIF